SDARRRSAGPGSSGYRAGGSGARAGSDVREKIHPTALIDIPHGGKCQTRPPAGNGGGGEAWNSWRPALSFSSNKGRERPGLPGVGRVGVASSRHGELLPCARRLERAPCRSRAREKRGDDFRANSCCSCSLSQLSAFATSAAI